MKRNVSILIVENDSVIASVEEWRLKKLGYTICGRAANGIDALALIKEKKPDLVILDINLDGEMDGIEIAKVLDKQGNIPFIFLTAHGEEAIIQRAKGTLQYGYIKKPFNDDDLRIGIELALAKNRFIGHILTDNALYEMALNHLPVGVIITNNEGVVIYLNEYARSLTKCQDPPNIVHFREIVTIVDRTNGKPLENISERIKLEQSTIWIPDNSALITPDDESLPVTGNAAPLFDDTGRSEGMVVTLFALRDIIYFKTIS
ncbi:MAG: response regulator [Methanomicrobiales archaeon]